MNLDRSRSLQPSDRMARGLGWLGIGLGLYQLLAPRSVTRALGVEGAEAIVRTCGARGVATGVGALTVNPGPALWARSAGDALDLAALLALLADRDHPKRGSVKLALLFVGAGTAASLYCAQAQTRERAYRGGRTPDYSGRSGFPLGVERARGAAASSGLPSRPAALPSPARSPGPRLQATSSRQRDTSGYAKGSDYDY
ncbi:hypothetical protein HOP62_12515 [Halomonas sp. MCCC 1A17488]|uniref:DUF4267 domain-containing protein n=1 Tax=Billgrantia sulfidoxydans TaxID=2733484 RepID=A0ABX7W1E4_9GAMM|nr:MULTISPECIES: hypothetical protein [Halomonas]MCE8016892.1 hypothetical protein [Halomonas sp. MCCC 1A17488]MCG3240225.1 hypothetical protein [Halomonas sp. MCCC 1A17488]QPP49898.1 hypothetical protein I4484_01835 [Halomonas sp. SS10-MC5]QTP53512.1 hypothetical protein HNO51_01740 [Halomonas sulfidoxydans]